MNIFVFVQLTLSFALKGEENKAIQFYKSIVPIEIIIVIKRFSLWRNRILYFWPILKHLLFDFSNRLCNAIKRSVICLKSVLYYKVMSVAGLNGSPNTGKSINDICVTVHHHTFFLKSESHMQKLGGVVLFKGWISGIASGMSIYSESLQQGIIFDRVQ